MAAQEKQTVAVTTGPGPVVLGGAIDAVVTIAGEPDRKARGVTAQLVRTAIHRVTRTNVLDHGSHDSLLREAVIIAEVAVIPPGGPAMPGEHAVRLPIPGDGLPSATDQVSWSVRAVIDRRHGADIQAESPVEVLAGPERFASEATSDPRYRGERFVDLQLPARMVRPGQAIGGTVILRPERALTVTEVLVTFVVTLPVKKGLAGTSVAPVVLLSEPFDLQPGDTRELPFELPLPADAAPSVRGSMTTPRCHSVVSWDVGASAKAVPAAGAGTGVTGFAYFGINVYNADGPVR
ncbi:MAG TPA: sporulation protein [Trebonia sp.]|jgi:hypothetical protein|nr:sporulation protein [Trebonia sp.]